MSTYLEEAYIIIADCMNPDCYYIDTVSLPEIGRVFRNKKKAQAYIENRKPIKCVKCGHNARIMYDAL